MHKFVAKAQKAKKYVTMPFDSHCFFNKFISNFLYENRTRTQPCVKNKTKIARHACMHADLNTSIQQFSLVFDM